MTTGFVLGKFAPFHKGHQLLVETALRENDDVVVLVYDAPDVTNVPLPVRAGWIRTLYPCAHVIEGWNGPLDVGDTPEIMRKQETYIAEQLAGKTVDAFYSSEFYGGHVSAALGAIDRRIDPDRNILPVSGTAIRENPFEHRRDLDPVVYRDLITKVVFLGAPSTGKTTIARELAARHNTVWMPEYGREYWDAHQRDRQLTLEQLVEIAEGHRTREDELVLDANRTIFIDTDATTTFQFSMHYHGTCHPRLIELADQTRTRYDLFFLCEDDIPYDNTWDRSGEANRQQMQQRIKIDLRIRGIPYLALAGSLEQRMRRVDQVLATFDRFAQKLVSPE